MTGWRVRLQTHCNTRWYTDRSPGPVWRALARVYGHVADARARKQRARAQPLPVPVMVIGNITAGGAGKTPVTLALAALAGQAGLRAAIVSRGYGARRGARPHIVQPGDRAADVGDEPLLLARGSGVPVCIARTRADGVRALSEEYAPDLVLADDGLQHYRMARAAEICVVDGARGLGNGHRLPAGPLREPPGRLADCDLVVVNGPGAPGDAVAAQYGAVRVRLRTDTARALHSGERRPLADFAGQRVRALAGIAHPARFFDALRATGLDVEAHPLADHAAPPATLLAAGDLPLLMTEKDAVKIDAPPPHAWAVEAILEWEADGAARATRLLQTAAQTTAH